MRRAGVLLAVLLVGGLTLWGLLRTPVDRCPVVRVVRVEEGAFVREVEGSLSLEGEVETLAFSRSGTVGRVRVGEGSKVESGQVLVELDLQREEQDLAVTRFRIKHLQDRLLLQDAQAQANLDKLKEQLRQAQAKLELNRRLLQAGVIPVLEVQSTEAEVNSLRRQINLQKLEAQNTRQELELELKNLQTQLSAIEASIRAGFLVAPTSGTILEVSLRAGQAAQGQVRLLKTSSLYAKCKVVEAEALEIRIGMPVRLELDALGNQVFRGKVARIGMVAEGQGSAYLTIFVDLQAPMPANLRPGLTGSCQIQTLSLHKALLVPLEALVEEGASSWVVAVNPNDQKTQRVELHVLARNATHAAVEGLTPGLILVEASTENVAEGNCVQYLKHPNIP